jgi:TPR repeat protein
MGIGIPRDLIEAYLWASLSAAKGNEEGQELQTAIRQEMTPAQISKAKRLVRSGQASPLTALRKTKEK